MQRKMEYLAASQAAQEPPSAEEVEAFFTLRREQYRQPATVSFAQVYVDPDIPPDAEQWATDLRARLQREDPGPDALWEYGHSTLLEPYYGSQTARDLASTFGEEFAAAVLELEAGVWSGPIPSPFGLHLVQVLELRPSRIPEWQEVATRVRSDMEYEARNASMEQLYQEIAQNYRVLMDSEVRELLESDSR
jgi:hypothetical protein